MQHILSLSYSKDSLSCLGAIDKLGWPLDRAVTAINDLLARAESEEARAEKAERKRDEYKVALQNWHEED